MRKERISVGLSAPALKWVKREAEKLGVSVGDYVRRLIDAARESK